MRNLTRKCGRCHRLALAALAAPARLAFPTGVSAPSGGSRFTAVSWYARTLPALPGHALPRIPKDNSNLTMRGGAALLPGVNAEVSAPRTFL